VNFTKRLVGNILFMLQAPIILFLGDGVLIKMATKKCKVVYDTTMGAITILNSFIGILQLQF